MTLRLLYSCVPRPIFLIIISITLYALLNKTYCERQNVWKKIRILGSREYHANRKTAKSMF